MMEGDRMNLREYAESMGRPELVEQWHREKNGNLTPEMVSPGSERRVWWRCGQGHEWESLVFARARQGRGCPYCAGQRVIPGQTDLAARYPEVARRWHPEKNGTLTPEQVMPGSHKSYWWRCERGHEWQAVPFAMVGGSGCPYCAGKRAIPGQTDLATTHPELAAQWHPERNGGKGPGTVSAGSVKRVWWRCERGHDYQAPVFSRASGTGCPYCAGKKVWPGFNDLATVYPALAREWHGSLNGTLGPEQVTRGSHRKVWWQCPEGHVWKTVVYARAKPNGTGCPVCAGKVKRRSTKLIRPRQEAAQPLSAP